MNKRQLELAGLNLENERAVLNKLEKNYAEALAIVKSKIELLQADKASASKIYQIQYQKRLEKQIEGSLKRLKNNNYTTVDGYLKDCYKTGFIGNMYDLQGQGVPMVVPIDPNKAISIARKTADGFKLSEKLGGNTKLLKKQVLSEISRGISAEKSYQAIARNISNYGQANLNRTMRIVRTESGRIHSEATSDSIKAVKERGADVVKQWDSTLDGNTRLLHRQLDGKYCEVDEPFEVSGLKVMYPGGFGTPSEDCNCRCRIVSRARLAVEGEKTYSKMNNITGELIKCSGYKDFEKKYLERLEKTTDLKTFKKESLTAIKALKQGENVSSKLRFGKYSIGKLPDLNELKNFKSTEVIIERQSLERIIKKHGKEIGEKEWLMIEDVIKTPDVIADNIAHHKNSILLYKFLGEKSKSCMECAIVKHNAGYVIHYQKITKRKVKNLDRNNKLLWNNIKVLD
ncbi:MAG: phage head morphogenesis protein [Candidatus Fimenecus sp.]